MKRFSENTVYLIGYIIYFPFAAWYSLMLKAHIIKCILGFDYLFLSIIWVIMSIIFLRFVIKTATKVRYGKD